MRGTRGVRTPLKISTSVFRGSVERSLLPSAVFLIFAECRPQLKTRRSLLQAVFHWNVAEKARKKRKKTASFVASLRWRTAVIERTTCDLCLSAIRASDNLLLCLWPSKRNPQHCGESTGKFQKRPGQRDKVPSVPISCGWFESCSCWFLESASVVKQRENDKKLKSLVHYIVFCGKQNILLRGHPNEKVNQATVSRLSSASDGPRCCLTRKQDLQGISLLCLSFKAKLMIMAALLRNFHGNTYVERKQVKHLSAKIQNELTDCWRKALALASAGGCKSSIRIECLLHCLASTLPHSFRVSVSLLSEILPTNLSNSAKNSALSVSCAPSTDVSGYAPG